MVSLEEYFAMCNKVADANGTSYQKIIQKPVKQFRKKAKSFEHSLQMDVINFLRHNGLFAFAIPNGGFRSKKTAIDLKKEGVLTGVADVCVMLPEGRTVWIELKRGDVYGPSPKTGKTIKLYKAGEQSDNQKEFENKCKELGHEYHVAYSVKDVADIFGLDAGFYGLA